MKVEIRLDAECREPRVVILTDRMTDEVSALARRLGDGAPRLITGTRDGMICVLEPPDMIRVYAAAGKVFAVTGDGEYSLRLRLYELEERLDPGDFVRISNSEIINLRRAKAFDLSLAGTIRVSLANGESAYVSRRYVTRIRQVLGI